MDRQFAPKSTGWHLLAGASRSGVSAVKGALLSVELARMVASTCGFSGELRFDPSKPDGTPRKLLDTSRLTALGWKPTIALETGLESTYDWFRAHEGQVRQ